MAHRKYAKAMAESFARIRRVEKWRAMRLSNDSDLEKATTNESRFEGLVRVVRDSRYLASLGMKKMEAGNDNEQAKTR